MFYKASLVDAKVVKELTIITLRLLLDIVAVTTVEAYKVLFKLFFPT
jgi:hypothetical protein